MKIRAFFALRIPERVARLLADYADTLCEYDKGLDAYWVDSTSYHLTLCFLDEITLDQVQELERGARQVLAQQSSFLVPLDTLDYYPVNPHLALVAALTSDPQPLMLLHQCMVEVAQQCGIEYRDLGFRPHITLGRLPAQNRFQAPPCWPQLLQYTPADAVVLFQSRPGERGSIYTPLFEIPLAANPVSP